MATPYIGEIKLISWNFAPKGWAFCNGQLLPINQNQALFSILGTTYGGDGRVNFALPDMRGRAPTHWGSTFTLGERGGEEAHTLSISETPAHTHALQASLASNPSASMAGNMLARASTEVYSSNGGNVALAPASVTNIGGSQPHLNMQPYITINFIIALQGIFPSQN